MVKQNLIEVPTKNLFVNLRRYFKSKKTVVRPIDVTWSLHLFDNLEYGEKHDKFMY